MTTALQIRPFEVGDESAAVALWRDCGLLRPWNDPHKDIARKQAVQPGLFLVALLQGRVRENVLAGTAMGGYDGHRGSVYYLQWRQAGSGLPLAAASWSGSSSNCWRWAAQRSMRWCAPPMCR